MSFYSLANGELAQVPLADWHIALDVRAMGSRPTQRRPRPQAVPVRIAGRMGQCGPHDLGSWRTLPQQPDGLVQCGIQPRRRWHV